MGITGRRARGFTMLELMVTCAIVALMFAIGMPAMTNFIRTNRVSATARQLDADLQMARREAIKRNARVLVCPVGSIAGKCGSGASAWASGWLVCYDMTSDNDCDDTATGNPNPIRQHGAVETGLTLTGPTGVVRFNANGTQGAAGATSVTFTTTGSWSGAKSWVETVTATGNLALVGS